MSGGEGQLPLRSRPAIGPASSALLPRLPIAMGVGAALLYAALGHRWHDAPVPLLLGTAMAAALSWLLTRLAAEMVALRRLEQGIQHAGEGLLEPVSGEGLGWTTVGRLIPEHNTTVSTLSRMFRTVDECQTRFLDERNRIRTILESSPGALLGLTDELTVAIANRRAEALLGAEPGQLIGRVLFDLLRFDDRGRNLMRDAFLYKREVHDQELQITVAGAKRWFGVNLAFYTDDQDDLGGVMILQDVTEKRQLMHTVAMREKLVAMGELAAGVAHELNTPLGNILGYAQLLKGGVAGDATLAGYADIIATQSQRASRVVQDLLAYARKDTCSAETCDVNTVVRELVDAFIHCRLQRYGIDMRLELDAEPVMAEGSCGEIDIVVTNVLANAIHAVTGTPDPRIVVTTWRDGANVAIAVADNGPGVAEPERGRLFDPFYTTKSVGQGTGLGLFISQAMVTRRGGLIELDAVHAPGARFVIHLPAVHTEPACAAA